MRPRSLILTGSAALLLVGCAHHVPQGTSVHYVPDTFRSELVAPVIAETLPAGAMERRTLSAEDRVTRALSLPSGGAARSEDVLSSKVQIAPRSAATQPRVTATDTPGDPSQLNMTMLIKMGGAAKLFGANSHPDMDTNLPRGKNNGAEKRSVSTSAVRMADRSEKNKQPEGMLNLPMLIKMGGIARFMEGAEQKTQQSGPGMLNLSMLIKMGGIARGMENENARGPELRSIPEQVTSGGMQLPQVVEERRRRAAALSGTNTARTMQRERVGGRCFGTSCD